MHGAWLVTLTTADLGEIRVPMHFEVQRGNRFHARSRSGSLSRTMGTWRALQARVFGGPAFAGGALLHIVEGEVEANSGTLLLRGTFLSAFADRQRFAATLVDGQIVGDLRRASSGTLWATFTASPIGGTEPVRDYAALTREVRVELANRIYNPAVLETPRWQAFISRIERRLPLARDDAEALTMFYLEAQALRLSHFALLGAHFGEVDFGPGNVGAEESPPGVELRFPGKEVAHLVVRHFGGTPAPIEAAFAEIHAAGANTLILDLRGNTGGNLSSMTVASHLLREQTPAGVFVGPAWWRQHTALPDPQHTDLPVLDRYDLEAFFRLLREHGVLAGQVRPGEPHFGGRVFVLIDRRTASAAEPLAELLARTGRATLVGQRTAGAMLSSERITLQSGLVLLLPTADYFTAEGQRLEGVGVEPHVEVDSAEALAEALRRAAEATSPWSPPRLSDLHPQGG